MAGEWWEELPDAQAPAPSEDSGPAIRPFKPGESITNADGSISTELTVTVPTQGGWSNVPSLWMTPQGPQLLSEDQAAEQAASYSQATGESFPTFKTVEEAVAAARARSEGGGASQGSITGGVSDWFADLPDAEVQPQEPQFNQVTQEEFRSRRGGGSGRPAPRSATEIAASRGVETEGAPSDLRGAYLKLPPGARNELAGFMVNSYFKQRGVDAQIPVEFDKDLDTHLFKDPADGKWKPLNDIGLDWEDAKDVMKYVVAPTLGALGAGAAGTMTGSPFLGGAAALLADTTIAGGFRADDVQELIQEGLIPPESLSPGVEGAKESAWALGGQFIGGVGGRMGRKLVGGADQLPAGVDLDRKMVDDMLKRYDAKYGEQLDDLPLDKKMSMVAETAAEKAAAIRVQGRRQALERASGTQRAMLERHEKNKEDLTTNLTGFMQTIGAQQNDQVFRNSGLTVDQLIESQARIIDGLEAPARAELQRYDAQLAQAYSEADRLVQDILRGATDPERLPGSFKGVFDAAQQNFDANMQTAYREIAEATRGQRVFDIKPLQEELAGLRRKMAQDSKFRKMILGEDTQGLAPRQDIRIGGAPSDQMSDQDVAEVIFGQAFRRDTSGLLLSDAAKREMANDTVFNYDAINSALLSLRKRIRELPRSAGTDTVAQLSRIESVLEQVRNTGLARIDEGLSARQKALDATYRLGKETLDRGIGRTLADTYLQPRPGMDGLLKPSTFDKLFKGDAGAASVRDIRTLMDMDVVMAGPNNPIDMLGVQDNIRRGLLGKLKSEVTEVGAKGSDPTRVITPERFERFQRDYRDAIEFVFTPEQIKQMRDATGMKRMLEQAEAKVSNVKEKVMKFPWGSKEIVDDPAKLMRLTWPTTREDTTKIMRSRQLRETLREQGDPEGLLTDYRKLIAHDMMSRVTDKSGSINPYKLNDYLNSHQELLAEWYTSRGAGKSGMDMVNNMKAYADIGRAIMEDSHIAYADKDWLLQALNSASRAYVGIFTTPGRILTAVKQAAGGASTSKEADFILNPQKYLKNQEYYEIMDSPQFRALQRAGGHAIINSYREGREAEEAQPSALFSE